MSGIGTSSAVLFLLFAPAGVNAIEDPPMPGEASRSFLVTDFTIALPLELSDVIDEHVDLSAEPGWLFPVRDGFHMGPGAFYGAWLNGGWHSRWGLALRTRTTFPNGMQLDASPGLIIGDSPFPGGFAGVTAGISLLVKDWIGLSARLDVTRTHGPGSRTVMCLGLRLGATPGMVAAGIAAVGGAAAYIDSQMD